MSVEQRIIRLRGNVQGVGFRFVACRTAERYDIVGWVRNCPDGAVECVVEGEPKEINAFLLELREQMSGYIRQTDQQTAPATGQFSGFRVRY